MRISARLLQADDTLTDFALEARLNAVWPQGIKALTALHGGRVRHLVFSLSVSRWLSASVAELRPNLSLS